MPDSLIEEKAKEAAGKKAAELMQDGMLIGLGTGSTVAFFLKYLSQRCKEGLKIHAVATSIKSANLAEQGHIPLIDINKLTKIDVAVDGADEIDHNKQMIKGGGGALCREKIVASMADEMIVIVDEKKCVQQLGKFPLPLEILPFAYNATLEKIRQAGFNPSIRKKKDGAFFITDNENYIADLAFEQPLENLEDLNTLLHLIPGVIETGLFLHMAGRLIIGRPDGSIILR